MKAWLIVILGAILSGIAYTAYEVELRDRPVQLVEVTRPSRAPANRESILEKGDAEGAIGAVPDIAGQDASAESPAPDPVAGAAESAASSDAATIGSGGAESAASETAVEDQPTFDVVSVDPDGAAVIAGRAAPGASVAVTIGERSIGTATASERGEWVLIPDQMLEHGALTLGLEATMPETGDVVKSEQTVTILLDDAAAGATPEPQVAASEPASAEPEIEIAAATPDPSEPIESVGAPEAAPDAVATEPAASASTPEAVASADDMTAPEPPASAEADAAASGQDGSVQAEPVADATGTSAAAEAARVPDATPRALGTAETGSGGTPAIVPDETLATGGDAQALANAAATAAAEATPSSAASDATSGADAGASSPGSPVVVISEPGEPSRVVQGGEGGGARAPVTFDTVDYDDQGQIIVAGQTEPDADVRAYIDNTLLGDTRADAQGRWVLRATRDIDPGAYELRVDRVGPEGLVIARAAAPFERVAPDIVASARLRGEVIIQPGDNLWNISRALYGSGVQYTVIYNANVNQIIDPDLIFPGQVLVTPGSVGLERDGADDSGTPG